MSRPRKKPVVLIGEQFERIRGLLVYYAVQALSASAERGEPCRNVEIDFLVNETWIQMASCNDKPSSTIIKHLMRQILMSEMFGASQWMMNRSNLWRNGKSKEYWQLDIPSEQPDVLDSVANLELQESVEHWLTQNGCSGRDREMLSLRFRESQTYAEIGKRYRITGEAVRISMLKLFDRLKKSIDFRGRIPL